MFLTLLAYAMLTGPEIVIEKPQVMLKTLQQVAISLELMDPRETRFILVRVDEYDTDIAMVRRRYVQLRDAPPLLDAERFPSRAAINDLLVFNRAYRKYLEERRLIDEEHRDYIRHIISEVDTLYKVWDKIRDAKCEYYYVTVRRQALLDLKALLGEDDYWDGILPPHVPMWRFTWLK